MSVFFETEKLKIFLYLAQMCGSGRLFTDMSKPRLTHALTSLPMDQVCSYKCMDPRMQHSLQSRQASGLEASDHLLAGIEGCLQLTYLD